MKGTQGMFMRRDYRPTDTSWHAQGVCRDEDDTLFFHVEGERGAMRRRRAEASKAICRTCPVMATCAADALARREPFGTWGGMSEDERARELAGKPAPRLPLIEVTATSAPTARLVRTGPEVMHSARGRRVSTAPVIGHVRHLLEAGYSVPEIAKASDVMAESVRRIARGGELATERTIAMLLRVQPEASEVAA